MLPRCFGRAKKERMEEATSTIQDMILVRECTLIDPIGQRRREHGHYSMEDYSIAAGEDTITFAVWKFQ
jgi:predicted GTPase